MAQDKQSLVEELLNTETKAEMEVITIKPKDLNMDNQPVCVYLGKGKGALQFVHLVYTKKATIEAAVKELQEKHQIERTKDNKGNLLANDQKTTININQYDDSYPKELKGNFFCRIFTEDFEDKFSYDLELLKPIPRDKVSSDAQNNQTQNQLQEDRDSGCRIL